MAAIKFVYNNVDGVDTVIKLQLSKAADGPRVGDWADAAYPQKDANGNPIKDTPKSLYDAGVAVLNGYMNNVRAWEKQEAAKEAAATTPPLDTDAPVVEP